MKEKRNKSKKTCTSRKRIERKPAEWKDPATGELVLLTEAFINKFKSSDPAKFERLHQLNRRTEGDVLRMDFIPGGSKPK